MSVLGALFMSAAAAMATLFMRRIAVVGALGVFTAAVVITLLVSVRLALVSCMNMARGCCRRGA